MRLKTNLFAFFYFLFLQSLICQELDGDQIQNNISTCPSSAKRSANEFIHLYKTDKLDSARMVVEKWQEKCNISEPIIRSKVLLSLKQNNYNDSIYGGDFMYYTINYLDRSRFAVSSEEFRYYNIDEYFGFIPLGADFDLFTFNQFNELLPQYSNQDLEYKLAEFYSTNTSTLYRTIQDTSYLYSDLRQQYDDRMSQIKKWRRVNFALLCGTWIPTQNLKTYGVLPQIGFLYGNKFNKTSLDLSIAIRFLQAKDEYLALRKQTNTLESTNNGGGGYFGIDVGRDIFTRNNHELQLIGGAGGEGITPLDSDDENELDSQSVWTYNFNFGLSYRVYAQKNTYFALRAKYNIIDYTITDIVDLNGNYVSIQFLFGWLKNDRRKYLLKALQNPLD